MIAVRNLRYAWPGAADNLVIDALDVPSGRTVFMHGPSGCGKSTLLGLMAGVLQARQGTVSLLGQDWATLPAGRRDQRRADHVGVIFQQFNLLPYLSVLDNVLLPCRFSARRAARCEDSPAASARALLGRVGLDTRLHGRRADAEPLSEQLLQSVERLLQRLRRHGRFHRVGARGGEEAPGSVVRTDNLERRIACARRAFDEPCAGHIHASETGNIYR